MDDFSGLAGKSLHDFIRKSNKTGNPFFMESMEKAKKTLIRTDALGITAIL